MTRFKCGNRHRYKRSNINYSRLQLSIMTNFTNRHFTLQNKFSIGLPTMSAHLCMIYLPILMAPPTSLVLALGCLLTTRPKITLLLVMIPINQFHYQTRPPYFGQKCFAISTASVSLHSVHNLNIANTADSLSAIQSLQNPVIRTQTKLSCLRITNTIAESNQLSLMWVPSSGQRESR